MKRRPGLFWQFLRNLWSFKITVHGKVLTGAVVLTALTGLVTFSIPIYRLFAALVCVAVVASICEIVFWPRLTITGSPPTRATAGRPVAAELTLTNRSRFPAYDLSVGLFHLPPALREIAPGKTIRRLGGGRSRTVSIELLAVRRGMYELPAPRCYTTFPFNLVRTGPAPRRTCSLMVLPSFHPIGAVDVPVGSRYQPGGIALTSNVGESPEYIGNREYRPGDSMRRIDFRSWARLAKPIVREYLEEYYCRVALVLDTYVPGPRIKPRKGFRELEAAVSLSAAVADALSCGEYILDIFAAGPELYVFRSGRHTTHFENVLEILACVEESRRNPFALVAPALADELANISTVICVLLDWDADRQALVRRAAEAGCATKVVVVRRRRTTMPTGDDEDWTGPIRVLHPKDIEGGGIDVL